MTKQRTPKPAAGGTPVDCRVRPRELPIAVRLRDAGNARRDLLLIEASLALDTKDAVIADLRRALLEAQAEMRTYKQDAECLQRHLDNYLDGPSGVWG